jgi:adenylate cyclase
VHYEGVDPASSALAIDRLWQWAWDHHATRFGWAVFVLSYAISLPIWVTAALIMVALEGSSEFLAAGAVAAAIAAAFVFLFAIPGSRRWRVIQQWAAGEAVDPREALQSTYTFGRHTLVRGVAFIGAGGAVMAVSVGIIIGADTSRTIQYGIIGATLLLANQLVAIHQFTEAFLRPVRLAIAGNSAIGDSLPRSRPTFASWSSVSILATVWAFTLAGALIAAVSSRVAEAPVLAVAIATAMTLLFGVPITVGSTFAPSLRPIQELADGTERVASGDYSERLPVVQDDDLGALAASFNRMQAGLAERERLRSAFGSYVDPALATRLLEQGDDIFAGERLEVTVMFVDIRDFTPFAESNTAEDTVAHLNALFEIVVPAVVNAGGHVNKYLGDGALAVFGAPNVLARHADAAVAAALQIRQLVDERFDGAIRIGVGVNTGQVIAGTIGGAGKLEFTLIGDTVNVAARVEQLTKATGDTVLITQYTLDALADRPAGLVDRGEQRVKGKASTVRVHAIEAQTGS